MAFANLAGKFAFINEVLRCEFDRNVHVLTPFHWCFKMEIFEVLNWWSSFVLKLRFELFVGRSFHFNGRKLVRTIEPRQSCHEVVNKVLTRSQSVGVLVDQIGFLGPNLKQFGFWILAIEA